MNLLHAILLSVIEGVTEFLPVSSTGHLILASKLLSVPQTSFTTSFEICIQLGAILAIVFLYGKTILADTRRLIRVGFAFIPTAVIGFILYKFIKQYLLTNEWVVVASLVAGGIILILMELKMKNPTGEHTDIASLTPLRASMIGVIQALSVIPGVSRSAATIIGGQISGLSRKSAVEFSFLLAVPTMTAATVLDLVKSNALSFTSGELALLGIGSLVSFVTALIVVKLFMSYISRFSLVLFGVYRIIIAAAYFIYIVRT